MMKKIDLSKIPDTAKQLMVGRGAPKSMLRFSLTLDSNNVKNSEHARRQPISLSRQITQYTKSWEKPYGAWLMVIGSDFDEDLAVVSALGLMYQSMSRHAKRPNECKQPYLWRLFGGSYDRLRQNDDFRNGVGGIGMLILTNLAENSTPDKIEKARDLIAMYPDIPKVVTVAGSDPLVFSLEKLHINPTRVLHLGRNRKVSQI